MGLRLERYHLMRKCMQELFFMEDQQLPMHTSLSSYAIEVIQVKGEHSLASMTFQLNSTAELT